MSTPGRTFVLVGALAVAGCVEQSTPRSVAPPDTRAADEATLRATIKDWAAAAEAKDAARFVSFYTDDAVVMLANAPDISGMAAIREGIGAMMQDPVFALSFEPDHVVVARSGDLAYETGPYSMTMTGPDQKPATERGRYVAVWRKQADGTWKAAVDAPVSDPPGDLATPAQR
jgi:uncharacterized protein (TIGR02246 family)